MIDVYVSCSHRLSEVAFVGKAPGTYSMLLGGGYYGQRMNKIYRGTSHEGSAIYIIDCLLQKR